MKRSVLYITLGFLIIMISCNSGGKQVPPEPNNVRSYLIDAAGAISDNALNDIHTLDDWQIARNDRYKEFLEMMSLEWIPSMSERTPLNTKITGVVRQSGFHIEKLYYESLPGLFVRANLYIPDNIDKPRPAILYVCGHSRTQKVHYQAHPRKFAQLGFICLIIETIQFGEVFGEHWGPYSNGFFNWYSRGYNPAAVELWNAIRGIDLLISRPEVDTENIGVTGISGGGSQSFYIAAADQRIKAAAPVCGASTLKAQITARTIDGHCDCMMPINTFRQDFMDFGALIAPRPLLICQADRDGLNTIESVRELYQKTVKIYKLYDAENNIDLVETPGGHSYHSISRERIFSFFSEHLMGKKTQPEEAGDIDISGKSELSEDTLKVYVDGPPANDITTTIQDSFVKLPEPPEITTLAQLNNFRDSVRSFLLTRTFGAFPKNPALFSKILEFRTLDGGKYGEEIFSFISEPGWRLKVDIHWANSPDSLNPLIIVLRNYDEGRWTAEGFANEIQSGKNIAFFETRGTGEFGWSPELQWHVRRAAAWTGRTLASMQVYDLLRCIEFCRTLPGIDPGKISIAARDEMGVVALYGAFIDGHCNSVIIKNPPETQNAKDKINGKGPAIEMLNCLKITDIYQLPALIYPTETKILGEKPNTYLWSENILQRLGKKL